MKISISLPDVDLEFVDTQAREGKYASRSAAISAAIRLLRDQEHVDSYAAAWGEWEESGDAAVWDSAVDDGLR